jgi:hypothetical protein
MERLDVALRRTAEQAYEVAVAMYDRAAKMQADDRARRARLSDVVARYEREIRSRRRHG